MTSTTTNQIPARFTLRTIDHPSGAFYVLTDHAFETVDLGFTNDRIAAQALRFAYSVNFAGGAYDEQTTCRLWETIVADLGAARLA